MLQSVAVSVTAETFAYTHQSFLHFILTRDIVTFRRIVTFLIIAPYKYSYLLTYLLTYLLIANLSVCL